MKKCLAILFSMICMLSLVACGEKDDFEITITIPAGSTEAFVYSDEEICATKDTIIISSGQGLGDTVVILSPVNEMVETGYVATYLTPGMPVKFDSTKGEWFKVGVSVQNPTDEDIVVSVNVKNIEVRIE